MPNFWKGISQNTRQLDSFSLKNNPSFTDGGKQAEFYEMELGVVLDIVLDDKHPIFTNSGGAAANDIRTTIDTEHWPVGVDGKPASSSDIDYTWIGRALVRPIDTNALTDKDKLKWALPLDNNISEYPLINETVILIIQGSNLYYTKKLNKSNWVNNNLDFSINKTVSGKDNTELFTDKSFKGSKESVLKSPTASLPDNFGYKGYAGKYFLTNDRIRAIRRYEGDLVIESRHGQSIHMTAYDSNRANDEGKDIDYKGGRGNPMILIRNRQRPILKEGKTLSLNGPNPSTISGTKQEKNVGGYIEEDINHDGSSIHITSGKTVSGWVTTCYKKMFPIEEVEGFVGDSSYKPPTLDGDQIVIQSDRLIFSSRYAESLHYSKKRYGIVTDSEFTVDAHDQIVMTTHVKTVLNSPAIYLGEYDNTQEPAVLGQALCSWLTALCEWIEEHVHEHKHKHPDSKTDATDPEITMPDTKAKNKTVVGQLEFLQDLKKALPEVLSKRVFLTGGGFAPGSDGKEI